MSSRGPRRPRTKSAIVSRTSVSNLFAITSFLFPCPIPASPSVSLHSSFSHRPPQPPQDWRRHEATRKSATHTHTHTLSLMHARARPHTHHRKGDGKRQHGRAQHACQGARAQSPPYWGGSGQGGSCVCFCVRVRVRVCVCVWLCLSLFGCLSLFLSLSVSVCLYTWPA
jgi:hypothetical protein